MKPPPSAGFEQFGEVLQPLLGESAPTRNDIAPTGDVELIGHEPDRKERSGRGRNGDESLRHGRYILWKTLAKSTVQHYRTSVIDGIAVVLRGSIAIPSRHIRRGFCFASKPLGIYCGFQ